MKVLRQQTPHWRRAIANATTAMHGVVAHALVHGVAATLLGDASAATRLHITEVWYTWCVDAGLPVPPRHLRLASSGYGDCAWQRVTTLNHTTLPTTPPMTPRAAHPSHALGTTAGAQQRASGSGSGNGDGVGESKACSTVVPPPQGCLLTDADVFVWTHVCGLPHTPGAVSSALAALCSTRWPLFLDTDVRVCVCVCVVAVAVAVGWGMCVTILRCSCIAVCVCVCVCVCVGGAVGCFLLCATHGLYRTVSASTA